MAKLNELEVDDYLKACVDLEPMAIGEEFSRMSADYAYWNERYAAANRTLLECEWNEEKLEAHLYLKFKEPAEGKKPPTEATVDAAVKTDPTYEEAHLATIAASAEREHLRGVLEALRCKREMLISMGAQLRQEEKSDAQMMERRAMARREEAGL